MYSHHVVYTVLMETLTLRTWMSKINLLDEWNYRNSIIIIGLMSDSLVFSLKSLSPWSLSFLFKHSWFPLPPPLTFSSIPLEVCLWKTLGCSWAVLISQGSFLSGSNNLWSMTGSIFLQMSSFVHNLYPAADFLWLERQKGNNLLGQYFNWQLISFSYPKCLPGFFFFFLISHSKYKGGFSILFCKHMIAASPRNWN